ncbi:YciI family protein [Rhizobium oryzicola]|uniref:YciI family protein n=1 Tax=Rhizobium oryzicola TaxID=1232668 RepID=A0ABT8SW52_9HYPH|nr:YciI family protein [Rhizobium oryzicola]MDO1582658.1 YciI family protein [Rhizobium oryzicola]
MKSNAAPALERGLFVRFAESDPEAADRRATWIEAHKLHLRQSDKDGFRILLSGPTQPGDDGNAAALVIGEAPSMSVFADFSERDPFVVHGIYNRIRLLRWTPTLVAVPGFAVY